MQITTRYTDVWFGYEPKGRGFESLQARHINTFSNRVFACWRCFAFPKNIGAEREK